MAKVLKLMETRVVLKIRTPVWVDKDLGDISQDDEIKLHYQLRDWYKSPKHSPGNDKSVLDVDIEMMGIFDPDPT